MNLKEISLIEQAQTPEELFGIPKSLHGFSDAIKVIVRKLNFKLHPDHNLDAPERAAAAFAKFCNLHNEALQTLKAGTYGKRRAILILKTKKATYEVFEPVKNHTGKVVDWSSEGLIFHGQVNSKAIYVKISGNPSLNKMLENEKNFLKQIASGTEQEPDAIKSRFPKIIDSFESTIDGKVLRVNIMEPFDSDFVSLTDIREQYVQGIPAKHIAWMWRRLLETLMCINGLNITWAGATPKGILYNPKNHSIMIVNFAHSKKNDEIVDSIPAGANAYYAPEILKKKKPLKNTDLYSCAMCMFFAMGADQNDPHYKSGAMLQTMDIIACNIKASAIENPNFRIANAYEAYKMFDSLIHDKLGWKKQFINFEFPIKNQ